MGEAMRNVVDKYLHKAARQRREIQKGRYRQPRPMTGFWSRISEEERKWLGARFDAGRAALPPSEDPTHG